MGLRNLIRNVAALARSDVTTFNSSNVTASALSGASTAARLNVPDSNRPAESSVLAYACLTARREAIAGAPLLVTDAEDRAIESGPVVDLFARPNSAMDWDAWVRQIETHLTLYNVAVIVPVGDAGRPPEALDILHPAGLRAETGEYMPTGTPRVVRWHYVDPTTGQARDWAPEDIIVRMGYNPHAPMQSLAPVNVLKRTILSDLASREQNLGLFLNDATPRGYLRTDQRLTPDQADEVLEVWNAAHQGYLNRHKTAVVWNGMQYDKVQLSPAELEFMESLKAMRIDYYMVFRVYPAMLAEMTGETGLSQGSSTDEQRVAWWEDVGLPELRLIASMHQTVVDRFGAGGAGLRVGRALRRAEAHALARQDRRRSGGIYVWFNDAGIPALARHRASRIDALVKLCTQVGYRPDDASDYLGLGLPPHPDNLPRLPFSLTLIGEPSPAPAAPAQRADEIMERFERVADLARADSDRTGARQRVVVDLIARLQKQAAERWSRFFVEQRGRILKRVETLARADGDEYLAAVFPKADENNALVARIMPIVTEHLQRGWDLFASETGTEGTAQPFAVDDPRVAEAIERRRIQGLKVNDTTEEELRKILRTWADEGGTGPQLADSIAQYYKDQAVGADRVRPMTAARTQTAGIVNDGRLAAAQAVGGLLKYWVHGSPDDPRPDHLEAARQYDREHAIALDAAFAVGGEQMQAPGDAGASVGNVANCTCMLAFRRVGE